MNFPPQIGAFSRNSMTVIAVLGALAVSQVACDLTESPTRVEVDPRLNALADAGTASPEDNCGGRTCRRSEVCDLSVAGQRCVPSCRLDVLGACDDDEACVVVQSVDVSGCLSRCDPFAGEGCDAFSGCIVSSGDSICVLKRDAPEDGDCSESADCEGNLVCSRGVCQRQCLDGAGLGQPGACGPSESCERVIDGVGVCL